MSCLGTAAPVCSAPTESALNGDGTADPFADELFVFPGNGLGIDKMGLGVELLLGEQRVPASLLVVTTQLMSLLKNSSTVPPNSFIRACKLCTFL